MNIDPNDLAPRDAYQLLTSVLVPRPIAWVSTVDPAGRANLAPFSFFGGVSSHPPIVMLSVGRRRGAPKDTAANLLATKEAVVHICHRPLADAMVLTSSELPPEEDEFEHAGLEKAPSESIAPPRIARAAIALETRLDRHIEIGDGATDLFLLHLVRVHVDDAFVVDGLADPGRLAAVGRLGGPSYCDTSSPFPIPRPD